MYSESERRLADIKARIEELRKQLNHNEEKPNVQKSVEVAPEKAQKNVELDAIKAKLLGKKT